MSEIAEDITKDLQAFYGRQLNKNAETFYVACLSALNEIDLSGAWTVIKQKERAFPTIDKIKEYCSEVRDYRFKQEKINVPDWSQLEKSGATPNGLATIQMMKDLYEGKHTRQQYLAKMFDMENKYPGIGWQKNANELKKFWESEPERQKKGEQVIANLRRPYRKQARS